MVVSARGDSRILRRLGRPSGLGDADQDAWRPAATSGWLLMATAWWATFGPSATVSTPAFLPELEVLPEYQGLAIGSTLLKNILDDLAGFYSIDGTCDDELVDYYQSFWVLHGNGM